MNILMYCPLQISLALPVLPSTLHRGVIDTLKPPSDTPPPGSLCNVNCSTATPQGFAELRYSADPTATSATPRTLSPSSPLLRRTCEGTNPLLHGPPAALPRKRLEPRYRYSPALSSPLQLLRRGNWVTNQGHPLFSGHLALGSPPY